MKKLLIVSVALILSACSTFNFNDAGPRIAIQYATGKYIEAGDTEKRAARVAAFVGEVKTFVDVQAVPVSQIKLEIIKRIRGKGLSPADTLLALALVDAVDIEIKNKIDAGVIDEDERIRINAVLNLIEEVAVVYQ